MTRISQASKSEPPYAEPAQGVLFDERQDRRLAEIYAPCFTLVLQLRAVDAYGEPEVLRKRLHDLLRRCERDALRAGCPAEDVQAAQFALVAFIDETILSSNWHKKEHWLARPLQLELYERYDAGEEFFVRLEDLRSRTAGRPEVLEVFYLCMTLGFKGRYLLHEQEKLRGLIEDTFVQLSRTPGMQAGTLSPNGRPRDQEAARMKSRMSPWALAVVAVALGVILYIGMSIYMSRAAEETVRAVSAVSAAPPASAS